MTKLVNRAKMTTATTGTGTITLGSAVDGFQTFADAGVANTNIVRYVIEDGSNWEIGLGTYSSTGPTLTRGSIESNNSDAAINLSGNAVVFLTAAAADLQELVDFADNFVLPTADGSTGQVLTTNGAGTLSFTTISGYTNADVDAHLNTGTASSGEVLSWTGSDYDWIAAPAALTGQTDSASPFETSLGAGAGAVNTGVNNTFIGYEAGNDNTTGTNNVAVGFQALDVNTTGAGNVGVGNAALGALTTGSNNVVIGQNAGGSLTTGSDNVAIGNNALDLATTGGKNIAVGPDAMGNSAATNASGNNVSIGSRSGFSITGGTENVLLGSFSGDALTDGGFNVAIGNGSLGAATGAGYNVAIGSEAMGAGVSTTYFGRNVTLGQQTGYGLSTGTNNFLGGYRAGYAITTGSNNVAIGNGALDAATTGGRNIAIGQDAMGLGVATAASGDNVAIGYQAGYDLTSGDNNVLLGASAGANLTTGRVNIIAGPQAGLQLTTGQGNIAIGVGALDQATTGGRNIAIGEEAMGLGIATATSGLNTVIGYQAGNDITSAVGNTLLGYRAGYDITTGGRNVHIGYEAGDATTTGSNQIVIGDGADASAVDVSNEITLGNSSITTLRCQVTTITSLSDARDKTDIQPLKAGLDFVETLNPVSFTWNMRDGGKVGEADTGFIAQDLQMAQEWAGVTIPGLVYDVNPDKLEAGYGKLIPVLVQAIKDLSAEVKTLKAQLEAKP